MNGGIPMKRTRKRIISILAAAALLVCSMPQSTPLLLRPAITASAAETSGSCGENLTWILDSEGTLTISGEGEMTNYEYPDNPPWYESRKEILNIVIEDGVTTVGKCAFESCENADSVALPDGLTSIGESAFFWCYALKDVRIPEGVTAIGSCAFEGCKSLTEIIVPDSVLADGFGTSVFSGCYALTSAKLPDHLYSVPSFCTSLQANWRKITRNNCYTSNRSDNRHQQIVFCNISASVFCCKVIFGKISWFC